MPEIVGLYVILLRAIMFCFTIWFKRERWKVLQSVAIVEHIFSFMVKSFMENGMEAEIRGLVMAVRVLHEVFVW
jgi:ABC-type uncharacterized transport system permease subunit